MIRQWQYMCEIYHFPVITSSANLIPQSIAFILVSGDLSNAGLIISSNRPAESSLSLTNNDEFCSKAIGFPSRRMENLAGQDNLEYGVLPIMTVRRDIAIAQTS